MNVLNRVTLKTLRKNKSRTIVTIIGVILSVAMVTAITAFISSMQDFMLRSTAASEGDWQASVLNIPYAKAQAVAGDDAVKESGLLRDIGSVRLPESVNPSKPYLYVQAIDANVAALRGIQPTEGRLPENDGELMISAHIAENGGVKYAIGQQLTLEIGDRVAQDGEVLVGNLSYDTEEPEDFRVRQTKTYTVVGICARPSTEEYSAGGYSVFTRLTPASLDADAPVTISLTLNRPKNVFDFMSGFEKEYTVRYHASLLRYMGVSGNDNFNAVLYSMASILIALIMVGSISLIYNAFAISVSERSKQFGMLSSAGATSRQIRNSVFFEALAISSVGIPLGLLSGVGGIGVTLKLIGGLIADSGIMGGVVEFQLSVSVPAMVIAAAVGLATVLISAYIPARRAARLSAMDAIRQTADIKLNARQVKTSRLTRRLFGMEGDLALKNFKRNRRRYRATVFSLIISVVLFISVSTYTDMLKESVGSFYAMANYDIAVSDSRAEPDAAKSAAFLKSLRELGSVEQAAYQRSQTGFFFADASILGSEAYQLMEEAGQGIEDMPADEPEAQAQIRAMGWKEGQKNMETSLRLIALDDATFARYAADLGLSLSDYTDPSHPRAIVIDSFVEQNQKNKYISGQYFRRGAPLTLKLNTHSVYDGNRAENQTASITLGTFTDKAPLGLFPQENSLSGAAKLIVSNAVLDQCFGSSAHSRHPTGAFAVKAADLDKADSDIRTLIKQNGSGYSYHNYAANAQESRNTLLVANVLSYGFIVLISLITVANVFNTISTNVNLRRREFAMLKSVGMTTRGFNKMMNFECVFYGLKALLFGLPVSLLISLLIRQSLNQGIVAAYELPWLSVGIAVLSVFLVVFVTMLYAMSKVRKENIIDALKNENL